MWTNQPGSQNSAYQAGAGPGPYTAPFQAGAGAGTSPVGGVGAGAGPQYQQGAGSDGSWCGTGRAASQGAGQYPGYSGIPQASAGEYQGAPGAYPTGGGNSPMATATPGPQRGPNGEMCAPSCGNDNDPGVMTFVGTGAGDYVTETSYRFVGYGSGEFTLLKARRTLLSPALCILFALIVAGIVAFVAWPNSKVAPSTTARQSSPPLPRKQCLFWGDPHLVTFDGSKPSFYGEGEFWVVRSPTVKIQGRYMGTQFTHGLAATDKIALGGPFLGGHRITVGPMEGGDIRIDDVPVLQNLGTEHNLSGLGSIRYDSSGELVDPAQADFPLRVVHMELPQAVSVTVFRWNNYLDLKIVMPPGGGVDGSCGNSNGDPSDDTTDQIFQRVGPRVGPGENLFHKRAEVRLTPEMEVMLDKDCGREELLQADEECRDLLDVSMQSKDQLHACMYDVCFGRMEHAQRTAKTFVGEKEVVVDEEAAKINVNEKEEDAGEADMEQVDNLAAEEHAAEAAQGVAAAVEPVEAPPATAATNANIDG